MVGQNYSNAMKIIDSIDKSQLPQPMKGMLYNNGGIMEFWNKPIEITHIDFLKQNNQSFLIGRFLLAIESFEGSNQDGIIEALRICCDKSLKKLEGIL